MIARWLLILIVACFVAGVARADEVDAERKALAALKHMGIDSYYDWNPSLVGHRWCYVDYRLKVPPVEAFYGHLATFKELRRVQFYDSPVTDDEFERIGRLTTLTSLDVINGRITGAGVKHLAGLKHLRQVDFSRNPVQDVVFDGLAHLPNLTTINLERTRVTGAGIQQLAGLKQLWFLSLDRTPVTDVSINGIGLLTSLTQLELSDTGITDASVAALSCLSKLEKLDIRYTRLTPDGLQRLRKALPRCAVRFAQCK